MPKTVLRTMAVTLAAIAYVVCSATTGNAITYGAADGNAHPYAAAIVTDWITPGKAESLCSGTLVAPRIVLTAAHCFAPGYGGGHEIYVTFDASYRVGVSDIQHGTVVTSAVLDLAVVHLDQAASIAPAQLPAAGALAAPQLQHERFTLVGYGITRGQHSNDFDYNVEPNVRNAATAGLHSVDGQMLTLASDPAAGSGGGCYGDSGGGIFLGDTVVAAFSGADGACLSLTRGSRLDTAAARQFLASQGVPLR